MRLMCLLLALGVAAGARGQEADAAKPEERLQHTSFKSKALDADVRLLVQLPEGYSKSERYPVIVFLHGAGRGNERTWEQRGAAKVFDRLVKEGKLPPSIVVCPFAGNSFYINAHDGTQRFEDMIAQDLVAHIDATYPTRADRSFRALLGDSMGGFGALLHGFKHPGVFGSVAAHGASIFGEDPEDLPDWVRGRGGRGGRAGMLSKIFGDPLNEKHWAANNLFHLAKELNPESLKGLRIYFDVGKDDRYGIAPPTQKFHELLQKRGVPHEFHLREGGHGRDFFMENLPHSLEFLGNGFKSCDDSSGDKPGINKGVPEEKKS